MRFVPETLLLFLAAFATPGAADPPEQAASPAAPTPSPSPSPSPRYKLIPYGFETPESRSAAPLLRFKDEAEVRSLEMNEAIARFFDADEDRGNMLRGATPGGAPTLDEMAPYRPHVTAGADLFGAAMLAVKELTRKLRERRAQKEDESKPRFLAPPSPSASPSPSTTPLPSGPLNQS